MNKFRLNIDGKEVYGPSGSDDPGSLPEKTISIITDSVF